MIANRSNFIRQDGRGAEELRKIIFKPGFSAYPEGSILIKQGNTHVLCNVTIEEKVPAWFLAQGKDGGWVTAEYAMLPRATQQRNPRETIRPKSRSQEIRRIIGRALRAGFGLERLPAFTCTVDCDVLQADGGTRTAAITGGYVALVIALAKALSVDQLSVILRSQIAATSVGWLDEKVLLDLDYDEDSAAQADVNVVMNNEPALIEVQGTAESGSISRSQFEAMLDVAQAGIDQLFTLQSDCLQALGIDIPPIHNGG